MPQSPALTSDETTRLRGATTLRRFLSPVPDTTVATARVNQGSFAYPIAQLTVDGTSGGWSNVREGQTVYIGSAAGLHDRGIYRVRKAGNSTTLYIGEISSQDPGLLAVDIRTAGITDNDYITVLQRWDLHSVLPVINPVTGLITEDYDKAVGTFNTTPPPLVYIKVNGKRNHLFTYTRASTISITATVTVTKWPTSAGSTLSYAWVAPSGWTSVSGTTTATLTATAAPGNYILRCTVTDSIGGATERIIIVNIHHDTLNPPLLISEQPRSDQRDRTGRRMTFPLYNTRLASIPHGTMVGYLEVCTWAGLDVPTATTQFVGWLQRYDFSTEGGLKEAGIEIVGPAALLAMMQIVSQSIEATGTADTWQKVVPALSSNGFLAWYMLQWRVANLLRLFNLFVYSVDIIGQGLPKWIVDKGSALQQIQQLVTERGNFGANSEGEFFFLNHPSMIPYGDRDDIIVRDTLDASIYKSLSGSKDLPPKVQQVRGEGFSWDGSSVLPTAYYSDAPKSPGQGSSQIKLPSQVVTGQAELEQLTGHRYAQANNPYSPLTATIERNRDVYEPAELYFVALELPAALSPTGEPLEINTIPQSVTKRHNPNGTSDIIVTLEAETHNLKGDFVPVPEGNDNNFGSPSAPSPTDPIPPPSLGGVEFPPAIPPTSPATGNPVVSPGKAGIRVDRTANKVYWSPNYTVASPTEYDVTPTEWFTTITHAVMYRGKKFSRRAYVLGTDGTDSRLAVTEDVFSLAPVWTLGAVVDGPYDRIESVMDKPDAVYIFGGIGGESGGDEWEYEIDFTTVSGSGTATELKTGTGEALATWVSGTGWKGNYIDEFPFSNLRRSWIKVTLPSPRRVTRVEFDYSVPSDATTNGGGFKQWIPPDDTGWTELPSEGSVPAGTGTIYYNDTIGFGDPTIETLSSISLRVNYEKSEAANNAIISRVKIFGLDGNPFTAIAYRSRFSSDAGATFGAEEAVGSVFGDPGFSSGVLGISTIAGSDEMAIITNDHDGVGYRDANNGEATASYPQSLLIPSFRIGSTSLSNKGINPNYFMAFNAIVLFGVGDEEQGLVKVIGTGRVDISPVVSGDKAVGVSPFGLDAWKGKHIVFIGFANSTRYVFMSKTTGAGWVSTAISNAVSVRGCRHSSTGNQWLLACGTGGLKYSGNGGRSWASVSVPGSSDYAELFGN